MKTLIGAAFQSFGYSGGNGFSLMRPCSLCSGGNPTYPQDVAMSEELFYDYRTVATLGVLEAGTQELGLKQPSVLIKWN